MKTPETGKDTNVLRKTPEEIKKGLEYCNSTMPCAGCPYDKCDFPNCVLRLLGDALAYIKQLESRLAQVERERNAAVADLSDSCRHCRFVKEEEDDSHCVDCFQRDGKYPWSPMVRTKFEWRGVCPKNTKEDTKE